MAALNPPGIGVLMDLLTGNKAVEDADIPWVMKLERWTGRQPQDHR
jgi:hypothetical protein